MARIKKSKAFAPVTADKFLGINTACAAELSAEESPDVLNFRITEDYKLQKREGFRYLDGLIPNGCPVKRIWYAQLYKDTKPYIYFARHESGYATSLQLLKYDTETGEMLTVFSILGAEDMLVFFKNAYLYTLGNVQFFKYDGESLFNVEGTLPTIYLNAKPDLSDRESSAYQPVNMLSGKRRVVYKADGSAIYTLAQRDITQVISVICNGVLLTETDYSADLSDGKISFKEAAVPQAGAAVEIIYSVYNTATRIAVTNCKYSMFYGGVSDMDLFVWGNTAHKNTIYHTYMGDVEYFAYSRNIGNGSFAVTDVAAQGARQIIFTENEIYGSETQTQRGSAGVISASYPVRLIKSERGNILPGGVRIINNCPFFVSNNKSLYRLAASSYGDDRAAVYISLRIQKELSKCDLYSAATIDFESQGEYIIACDDRLFIYNYRNDTFYIYDNIPAKSLAVINDELYFGTDDGAIARFDEEQRYDILTRADGEREKRYINAYWISSPISCGSEFLEKSISGIYLGIKQLAHCDSFLRTDLLTSENSGGYAQFALPSGKEAQYLYANISAENFRYLRIKLSSDKCDDGALVLGFRVCGYYGGFINGGG